MAVERTKRENLIGLSKALLSSGISYRVLPEFFDFENLFSYIMWLIYEFYGGAGSRI